MIASRTLATLTPACLHLNSRNTIPQRSGSFWQVEQGLVRTVTWDQAGHVITLGLWGPADVVGPPLSKQTPFQFECLGSVVVRAVSVDSQDLERLMRSQLQYMAEFMRINSYKRAPQKLFHFLNWLGQRFGQPVAGGQLLELGLTHHLMAEIMGLNRITTAYALNKLAKQGKIQLLPNQCLVLSPHLLQPVAALHPCGENNIL